MLMFNEEIRKKEKKSKDKKDVLKKALGMYSTGFIITTDVATYFLKRTLLIFHEVMPVVLLHKGVDLLQDTRDSIGKGLSDYVYCSQCKGNGVVYVESATEGKLELETCPLCSGTGKYIYNLVRDRSDEKLTLKNDQTKILTLFDKYIKELLIEAREEQEQKQVRCIMCAGEGVIKALDNRKEPCAVCQGIGKDYSRLSRELKKRYITDLIDTGIHEQEAQLRWKDIYPGQENKAEIIAKFSKT
jgi:hypothetical protein